MKKELKIEINQLPPMYNVYLNMHYLKRMKVKRLWLKLISDEIKTLVIPFEIPIKKYDLSMTRLSTKEPDYDGLVGSAKILSDVLQKIGITDDDKLSNTGPWQCTWEKVRHLKDQKVIIRIAPK